MANAWNEARRLAFSRLEQEARLAGAHAVVGVSVSSSRWAWAKDAWSSSPPARRCAWRASAPPEHPALTDLSGQDYWKLRESGYEAVGAVGATSVWMVIPGRDSRRAILGGWFSGYRNQEIPEFVQGIYQARNQARANFGWQAQVLGGEGVVGMNLHQDARLHKVERENAQDSVYMVVTMHALGTAIVSASERRPTIKPIFSLG